MERIFIGLGANLGDPVQTMTTAQQHILNRIGPIKQASSFYQTDAWGNPDQPDFINQVIEITSKLHPQAILESLLSIESLLGRTRVVKWEARLIDLDLLFYGQRILQEPDLIIPHPYIHLRNFVLVPLVEIAPDFYHPVLKHSMADLLTNSPDLLDIKQI